jgi:hypothetical protein
MDMNEQQPPAQEGEREGIKRDTPNPDPARAALVKEIIDRITTAKKHWDKDFKRMRDNMRFVRGLQWQGQKSLDSDKYVANITLRHLNQSVAAIYAKNPKFVAKRRNMMDFAMWDGKQETMLQAMMGAEQQDPMALAMLEDITQGKQRRMMLDKVAKSLELVMNYSINEIKPRFKAQAKQLVRRAKICGVGYVKLAYQRLMETNPEVTSQIADMNAQLDLIERLADDMADGETQETSARVEELRIAIANLQKKETVLLREGLVFDFPKATSIIICPDCVQLTGFVGAKFLAQEYIFSPDRVKELYKVDIGKQYNPYTPMGSKAKDAKKGQGDCCVWEFYNLETQQMFVVCDGYNDFLKEGCPDVEFEQFHPFFSLVFNEVENEDSIYPPSDIDLMRPMQVEYNRAREGIREHRQANRPAYISAKGLFSEADKEKLGSHDSHEVLELDSIPATGDTDIRTKLQAKPTVPIDQTLYDTEFLFADTMRVTGSQEANLGGTSGASATEVAEASQTRVSSVQSNIDELDEMLIDLAREASQVLLRNMSKETVQKIAGIGAVWPEVNVEEIVSEVALEVAAGSSGRPNKAQRLANFERVGQYLMQVPNLNPMWLLKQLITELDETIDLDDAVLDGMPSINALNGNMKAGLDPANNPNNQGDEGRNNVPAATGQAPQSQPAYPA